MKNRSFRLLCTLAGVSLGIYLSGSVYQAFAEDVVTLNSGEIIKGRILDSTDTNLSIEAGNYNHTIFVTKVIAKTDIKTVERETAESKKEKADYAVISAYRLDPNQEFTESQYTMGIAAFNKFLTDHPKSQYADDINQRIVAWSADLSNVQSGKVKFANQWMTPDEKRVQAGQWQKQNAVQSAQNTLQSLKSKLADLQRQRGPLAENLGTAKGQLAGAQTKLQSLQDTQVPVNDTVVTDSGMHHDIYGKLTSVGQVRTEQRFTGAYQTVVNPERAPTQRNVAFYSQQVGEGQAALATLDGKMAEIQSQIPRAEQNYEMAVAHSQEPVIPVVAKVEQTAPPPPPPQITPPPLAQTQPVTASTPPWYTRLWNWL